MRPNSGDADEVPVRSVNRLLFLLALTAACQRQAARPSADSQRLPNPATPAVATVEPVQQTAAPLSSILNEPRQVCDSVAHGWRDVPFSHVELRDTVANPVNQDAAHPNRPEEVVAPRAACLVVVRADSGIDHTPRPLYWPAIDWVPILFFAADGPDGSVMTYQRGLTRCQVSNQWDGEDDSDTTYVPQKWFEQRTTCWQHNRPLTPADTAQPSTSNRD